MNKPTDERTNDRSIAHGSSKMLNYYSTASPKAQGNLQGNTNYPN
ncbi:MAG: hypothetical protein VXV91_05040 [Verrucomicrobiota bacterium]|nr:hypothetical protein [Verrucomicrobiota bacterium]